MTVGVMRQLVACGACQRQYDVSEMDVGARFHCQCGEVIKVPALKVVDAAVVRCRSCSGPREKDARACRYCGADFTLHEQDLQTICPACMARISDRARFCHHCGTPIVPAGKAGNRTNKTCPACGDKHKLSSRTLGQPPVSLLECSRCAGIWLGQEAFRVVVDRARDGEDAHPDLSFLDQAASPRARTTRQRGPMYRRCPACSKMMSR